MPRKILILKSDAIDGRAVINTESGIAKINLIFNIFKSLETTNVLKMYVLSSLHSTDNPIKIGAIEVNGTTGHLDGEYVVPYDIDTIAITEKNVYTENEKLLHIAFEKDKWDAQVLFGEKKDEPDAEMPSVCNGDDDEDTNLDMDKVKDILRKLNENEAYKAFLSLNEEITNPVKRAADVLSDIKEFRKTKSNDTDIHKWYFDLILDKLKNFEKVDLKMVEEFTWYKITSHTPFVGLSSFTHIMSNPAVACSIEKYGHYLIGVKEDEYIVALAFPVCDNESNPLNHINDCSVFLRCEKYDYSCVCILLDQDGQYLMPISENVKEENL